MGPLSTTLDPRFPGSVSRPRRGVNGSGPLECQCLPAWWRLDDGVLIVSPAPSAFHQLAVARLAVILSAASRTIGAAPCPATGRPRIAVGCHCVRSGLGE